jgi:beta-galactosidase
MHDEPIFSASRRAFVSSLLAAIAARGQKGELSPAAAFAAGDIKEASPLPRLTPCPQIVAGVARPSAPLHGEWRFHPAPEPDFWTPGAADTGWSPIAVPGEWAMQGFTVKPGTAAGYRLRFPIPADWAGKRVKLRFDAVHSKADVWLNGVRAGSHLGSFTPFEVDVTDGAKAGSENTLAVSVRSESLAEMLVAAWEMVGHQMGGIIRNVKVLAVPPVHVSSLHVDTLFDSAFRDAVLRVHLEIAHEGLENAPNATLQFALRGFGPGGAAVPLAIAPVQLPPLRPGQVLMRTIDIPVKEPKKWDAEHPNLYVLSCALAQAGKPLHTTEQRFGFRQVSIRGHQLLLNGTPIRLRGVSRQDSHPLMGRTVPPEVQRRDVELMVWANSNNAYTCAFLPDEEFLNLCDEHGLYVMDEPGTCWIGSPFHNGYWKNERSDDPKYFPHYLQPVLEMMERDRSHPSVITWMLADESVCGRNFRQVLKIVRALDPTRPVHFSWEPVDSPFDLASWHYPRGNQWTLAEKSTRPVIFDQSVHVYCHNISELMTDPGLRDDWGRQYVQFWEWCWKTPTVAGEQVFNMTDDVFLMPSGETLGTGGWGMIDYWRRPKPELYHVRKVHTPVKVADAPLAVPAPGRPLEIPIENRYDFTNLRDLRIEWSLGGESGTVTADVAPHRQGVLTVLPRRAALAGETLSLKFLRGGREIDSYRLPVGKPAEPPVPALTGGRPKLVQARDEFTVKGRNCEWLVNRSTGAIARAALRGKTVLTGGPVLMILPIRDEAHTAGFPIPRPVAQFHNATCRSWKATSVTARAAGDAVEIVVEGGYREAEGTCTYRFDDAGNASVAYRFTYRDAEAVIPRQVGVVFYVPRSCDTLAWKRRPQWSVYPEDHIGRAEGTARALRDPKLVEPPHRQQPPWPWYLDANAMGTVDFRATRRNIYRVSLADPSGSGLTVRSNGSHHTRAFLDGERVGLLVASVSAPGGVVQMSWERGMYEKFARGEHIRRQKGTLIEDTVFLSLA